MYRCKKVKQQIYNNIIFFINTYNICFDDKNEYNNNAYNVAWCGAVVVFCHKPCSEYQYRPYH